MKERMTCISVTVVDPTQTNALGDEAFVMKMPYDFTIVYVSAAPSVDDAAATLDIQDDGTDIITGIDVSDQNAPGEWKTPDTEGTNTPVHVQRGSDLSFDFNSAAAGTAFTVQLWGLIGS